MMHKIDLSYSSRDQYVISSASNRPPCCKPKPRPQPKEASEGWEQTSLRTPPPTLHHKRKHTYHKMSFHLNKR
eukprot:1695713-Amphidinium_carterae.1